MSEPRTYLFLQGPCTPFFAKLADQLQAREHTVRRINFTCGDALYGGHVSASFYRRKASGLCEFYAQFFAQHLITDLVLFGDCRPVHKPAIALARSRGMRIHVFEEGYFRPNWITLERNGVNAHSLLPKDPDWYWSVGAKLPDLSPHRFHTPFSLRAFHDICYHVAGVFNLLLYPGYRTHASANAFLEYASYLRRYLFVLLRRKHEINVSHLLVANRIPYYVLPLQLKGDAQIRDHSSFRGMVHVITYVIKSFAAFAPPETRLVVKNHPLDAGLTPYGKMTRRIAKRFGVAERVDYMKAGNLDVLLKNSLGVVTVNSTVGAQALQFNCPTITLADPIYNLPGLTFQGSLNKFWRERTPPDQELFSRFKKVVLHATQINGGFYSQEGIELAVRNSLPALEEDSSPLDKLL